MDGGIVNVLRRFNLRPRPRRDETARPHASTKRSTADIRISDSESSDSFSETDESEPAPARRRRRPRRGKRKSARRRPTARVRELEQSGTPEELYAQCVKQVVEFVPDVDPSFVLGLITENFAEYQEEVVEHVLHALLEDPAYPRSTHDHNTRASLERRDDESGSSTLVEERADYASVNRPKPQGPKYGKLAQEQLQADFPFIPVSHIRVVLFQKNGLYTPAYLLLRDQEASQQKPYKRKSIPTRPTRKGKSVFDADFDAERAWVLKHEAERQGQDVVGGSSAVGSKNPTDPNTLVECGCCFTEYTLDNMIECPDAHLFCSACIINYASTKLGSQNANLVCIDQSGCKLQFVPSQLRRFLPEKLLELYDRVLAQQSIRAAHIEGIEECPSCDFKCLIDDDEEPLFYCHNEDCLLVSCRSCKKPDHFPMSCEEAGDDTHVDAQHKIDEAMTYALMRNCPKCQMSFIKEDGCNKMTCPQCATVTCYVCREVIEGYDHFADEDASDEEDGCPLYDRSIEERHAKEVARAAKDAMEEVRKNKPNVNLEKVHVDVPDTDFSDWSDISEGYLDTIPPPPPPSTLYIILSWTTTLAAVGLSIVSAFYLRRQWETGAKEVPMWVRQLSPYVEGMRVKAIEMYTNRTLPWKTGQT